MDFKVPEDSDIDLKRQRLSRQKSKALFERFTVRVLKLIEYDEHRRQTRIKTLKSTRESILNEVAENKLAAQETPAWNRYLMEIRGEKIQDLKEIDKEIEQLE